VYRFNTDVWGTLSVFYSMFRMSRADFLMPDAVYSAVLQQYRNMFLGLVFANGHRRINVSEIVKRLRDINALIGRRHHHPQHQHPRPHPQQQQHQQPHQQHQQQQHRQSRRHRKSSMKQKKVRFNVYHTRRKHRPQSRVPTPHPIKGIIVN
jgi:hypothetical protein